MTLGLWDMFPVNPGHALLVTRRHVATWFDATLEEQTELISNIESARRAIQRKHQPSGYNIGINIGAPAGQTVFHLHVHIIPRYAGDVDDPRGGVRHVIPAKGNYEKLPPDHGGLVRDEEREERWHRSLAGELPHGEPMITGGDDWLRKHLLVHLERAVRADFAVAFILESGVNLMREALRDFVENGGLLRIVTGTYLDVTEPAALAQLLDIDTLYPGRVALRAFEEPHRSFHPKAFIFHERSGAGVAFVGSSNLTETALSDGIEWNFRVIDVRDRVGFASVQRAFDTLFADARLRRIDDAWIGSYKSRRKPSAGDPGIAPAEPIPPPEPHAIQQLALEALEETRRAGNAAGLVVLATGLGKTWLSAFDSNRPEYRKILFVAHREEILGQAMRTYRRSRPDAHLGLYAGTDKEPDADVLFASVQTLARSAHLERFDPQEFDYIVVDEFHHALARTYRRVIEHFEPRFMLGLTATPERTDGGDLLALCQENLVYRCDLAEGIREGLLSPFHYFGVPDEVDYQNIPWRSNRFDEQALTEAVATQARAANALEQYRLRAGARTLAFCCSRRHAEFMRDFFRREGMRAAAVYADPASDPRVASLEGLKAGELQIVFAVDMFNEGVDLPEVDTVMMLRPTESRILWLQQFGRGLRKSQGKPHVTVIDYIGNHRTFLIKPQTLFSLPPGDAAVERQLRLVQQDQADLPPGCEVTYELEAVEILRSLLRLRGTAEAARFGYEDLKERLGVRPTASEMYHEGHDPRLVRQRYGSWFRFVKAMADLTAEEEAVVDAEPWADFLAELEVTPMTKSYKMLVLRAMLDAECFPGEIGVEALSEGVARMAKRSARIQQDITTGLEDERALRALLEKDPIKAWTGGWRTGGSSYLKYENRVFATVHGVEDARRQALADLVAELVDWRLAQYLDRGGDGGGVR